MDDKLMNSHIDAMGSVGTDEASRTKLGRAIARERKRATDTKACTVPRLWGLSPWGAHWCFHA